jgi:hypothetical protein
MADKSSPQGRKAARASAETAAMTELRRAQEKIREKSERLKKLRLERDAAAPPKPERAVKRAVKSDLNLARTQRGAKPK